MKQYSRIKVLALSVGLACMVPAANVLAHHSFSAEFDADTTGTMQGVITEVRFTNPHVRYRMDVTMADGRVENWEVQAGSVTSLRAQGWNADTFEIGDSITVDGQLGRGGSHKIYVRGISMAGGPGFGTASTSQTPQRDRNTVYADPDTYYGHVQVNPNFPIDISGAWKNGYKFRVTVDDLEPKPTPYTEEGRRLRDANEKYDDPALRCISLGLPRIFGNPYNMDIYDAGDHYLFLYVEHNSPRRIWMDGRTPPADTRPTSNGYSVGRWEDDNTLVIETTHLLPGWLDGSGMPMSGDGTRTVERYEFREDHLAADRTMTIYDPLYTQPLVRTRGMAREDNLDVFEQDSCDPTSYFTDLREAGLLDEYLTP